MYCEKVQLLGLEWLGGQLKGSEEETELPLMRFLTQAICIYIQFQFKRNLEKKEKIYDREVRSLFINDFLYSYLSNLGNNARKHVVYRSAPVLI